MFSLSTVKVIQQKNMLYVIPGCEEALIHHQELSVSFVLGSLVVLLCADTERWQELQQSFTVNGETLRTLRLVQVSG